MKVLLALDEGNRRVWALAASRNRGPSRVGDHRVGGQAFEELLLRVEVREDLGGGWKATLRFEREDGIPRRRIRGPPRRLSRSEGDLGSGCLVREPQSEKFLGPQERALGGSRRDPLEADIRAVNLGRE